jgi:hypothetical protein
MRRHGSGYMRSKALVAPGCANKAGTRKFVYPAILLCMMVSSAGHDRVVHGGLLNVLRMVKRQWS